LRNELVEVAKLHPYDFKITAQDGGSQHSIRLKTNLLFHAIKAKANVTFVMAIDTFALWPKTAPSMKIEVVVAYGDLKLVFYHIIFPVSLLTIV
jgi:hypothetical protein